MIFLYVHARDLSQVNHFDNGQEKFKPLNENLRKPRSNTVLSLNLGLAWIWPIQRKDYKLANYQLKLLTSRQHTVAEKITEQQSHVIYMAESRLFTLGIPINCINEKMLLHFDYLSKKLQLRLERLNGLYRNRHNILNLLWWVNAKLPNAVKRFEKLTTRDAL